MPEVWFNIPEGKLLIGEEAAASLMEQLGPDVVPLTDLLDGSDLPLPADTYERQSARDWPRERCIELGQWALSLLREQGEDVLTTRHIRILNTLGIGPHINFLVSDNMFGSVQGFQSEIGSEHNRTNNYFEGWVFGDYVRHAAILAEELGHCPSSADYNAAAERDSTKPKYSVILRRVGGINNIHDLIGYPDPTSWHVSDFVEWGVRIMQANDGQQLSIFMIDALSARKRSPNTRTITRNALPWAEYKDVVQRAYYAEILEAQESRKTKLDRYASILQSGSIPAVFGKLKGEKQLKRIGQYLLVADCTADLPQQCLINLARVGTEQLVPAILKANPKLTAALIETEAVRLGVADDIWPMQDFLLPHLRVSPEEIERVKAIRYGRSRSNQG